MSRTLILIKPDAIERKLIGEIIHRYEKKLLRVEEIKMIRAKRPMLEEHYEEHRNKDFFEALMEYMMSGDMIAMVVEGENAIEITRKINGDTNLLKAEQGSIRGDFAATMTENLVHGSDCTASAKREIALWFGAL